MEIKSPILAPRESNMRQYNILQAIPMSFYSRRLYKDVAINWQGAAVWYLLFVLALSWIPFTIVAQYIVQKVYSEGSEEIVPQIPILTIKNGIMSTPESRPYSIVDPKTKQVLAVIDTTGHYKNLEEAHTNVLITQTAIISKTKPNQISIDELPKTLSAVIDPQVVNQYLKKYLPFMWILVFPVIVLLSFVYRLIQSLIYGLIGKIFAGISGVSLSYLQITKIVMVALTPVIVIMTILDFFNIAFPFQALFYFLLAMVYLFYGILANKIVTSTSSKTTL